MVYWDKEKSAVGIFNVGYISRSDIDGLLARRRLFLTFIDQQNLCG